MKSSKTLSVFLCVTAALVVGSMAPVNSSAGLRSSDKKAAEAVDTAQPQGLGGTVSGTGLILVNGSAIQGPTRVASGNSVNTGPDGDATIDLGTLGTIRLRPNGSVRLELSPSNSNIFLEHCTSLTQTVPSGVTGRIQMNQPEKVEVGVTSGRALVVTEGQGGRQMKLKAVSNKTLHNFREVTSDMTVSGQSVVTVSCCQCCFVEKRRTT